VVALCGCGGLVEVLLSCEADEQLGEFLDVGRVTTFVADWRDADAVFGLVGCPLPTTFGNRPPVCGADHLAQGTLVAAHRVATVATLDSGRDTTAACANGSPADRVWPGGARARVGSRSQVGAVGAELFRAVECGLGLLSAHIGCRFVRTSCSPRPASGLKHCYGTVPPRGGSERLVE